MGMLYRRKKRDSFTQNLVEFGPWWIKYYRQGRPFYESTETEDKTEARRKLKKREGEVALDLHQGPQLASLKHSWRKGCEAVGLGRMTEVKGTEEKVWGWKDPP